MKSMLECAPSVSVKSYDYETMFCADVSQDMEMVQLDKGKLKIKEKKIKLNEHISIHQICSNKKILVKQDICKKIIRFNFPNNKKLVSGINLDASCMSIYKPNVDYSAILSKDNKTLEIEMEYRYFASTNGAIASEVMKDNKNLFIAKLRPNVQFQVNLLSNYLDEIEINPQAIEYKLVQEISLNIIEKILSENIPKHYGYSITGHNSNWKKFNNIIKDIEIYGNCINIDDIIREHNIHSRSLYNLFKTYIDISPSQYFLAYRLCSAQASLIRERCFDDPVTRAAVDAEFFHLGRFSQYYKSQFGCLPSETVKRACEQLS